MDTKIKDIMKSLNNFLNRLRLIIVILFLLVLNPVSACTIFVLTDSKRTLFFNNEDFSNSSTRLWFVPAEKNFYGCAYLGFNDGWAQGGTNDHGLAFDWVAGFNSEYTPAASLAGIVGNPSQRMLESCATIEDAMLFYTKFREPAFSYARIMIVDKSGASVIISAENGKLRFDRSKESRGFGYGQQTLNQMLIPGIQPTVNNGSAILEACRQEGQFATKYSNVFDLRSGDIRMMDFQNKQEEIKLNLEVELKKGGHFYELPRLQEQHSQNVLKPLETNMKRFLTDGHTEVKNADPKITSRVKSILQDVIDGTMKGVDYESEFWKTLKPHLKEMQAEVSKLGHIISIKPLEPPVGKQQNSYLFYIEFTKAVILQRYTFNAETQVTNISQEGHQSRL